MLYVGCSVSERFVNPLFEVFDGGDFVLSSSRDIEEPLTRMRIYFERAEDKEAAKRALSDAMRVVEVTAALEEGDIPDEDWKFAYRRHFKTEKIGRRLLTVPTWELEKLENPERREVVTLDPGMAFGTGKHETTRACLEYIEALAPSHPFAPSTGTSSQPSFLDMGCGSGILSIAAAKLGFGPVAGFDLDSEAVQASKENAALNGVEVRYERFALGRPGKGAAAPFGPADLVAANILGPLLIRFADEIVPFAKRHLVISGILTELYPEVRAAYLARGFRELSSRTIGEWTTGLLVRA